MASPRPKLSHRTSSHHARDGKKGGTQGELVIELPHSREYVPNSGPLPGPITLAPSADSTAYIIERILLPPDDRGKDGKPKPRKPTYIVGWHDLPGARLLVPAMDVLDYVSPWEVEQWETEWEKELSQERRKQMEEKKKAKEVSTAVDQAPPQKPAKKRGRPPKNAMIETAATAELEPEDDRTTRLKGGALSFTPQKTQLEEFVEISDTDGTPSRQLAAEQSEAVEPTPQDHEEASENYETAEDEPEGFEEQVNAALNNLGIRFDGQQEGSLPPLELQQTKPGMGSALLPVKQDSVEFSSQASGSRWKAVGKSPHTVSPVAAAVSYSDSQRDSILSKTADQSQAQDDLGHQKPMKPSSASKNKKQKPRSASTEQTQKPKKRKRMSEGQLPVEVEGEQQWIVKRLEDHELYNVEGVGLVRYFKVLWEGDWPPDQNPSWEPEGNLPVPLVRNFFKRSKDRLSKSQKKRNRKEALKQTTLSWANTKKYDSVSQAFAGDDDESSSVPPKENIEEPDIELQADEDIDNGEGELLVVNADQDVGAQRKFSWDGQRHGLLGITS